MEIMRSSSVIVVCLVAHEATASDAGVHPYDWIVRWTTEVKSSALRPPRCLEVAALDRPHSLGELIRLSPVILELAKSEQRRG